MSGSESFPKIFGSCIFLRAKLDFSENIYCCFFSFVHIVMFLNIFCMWVRMN